MFATSCSSLPTLPNRLALKPASFDQEYVAPNTAIITTLRSSCRLMHHTIHSPARAVHFCLEEFAETLFRADERRLYTTILQLIFGPCLIEDGTVGKVDNGQWISDLMLLSWRLGMCAVTARVPAEHEAPESAPEMGTDILPKRSVTHRMMRCQDAEGTVGYASR